VWIGTSFSLAEEAPLHPHYRERLLGASAEDALYATDLFDIGWENAPHRAVRSTTWDRWEAAGSPAPGSRPGEGEQFATRADGAAIVRYSSAMPVAASRVTSSRTPDCPTSLAAIRLAPEGKRNIVKRSG
jgi:nitronate monooxygenase